MLSNYIGGGQVFLHKLRMLRQVLSTTVLVSFIVGIFAVWSFSNEDSDKIDWDAAATFAKAKLVLMIHPALSAIAINKSAAKVEAYSNGIIWKKRMLASDVIKSNRFSVAWYKAIELIKVLIIRFIVFGVGSAVVVFFFWSKFGRVLKSEKKKDGSGKILTADAVRSKLKSLKMASEFTIGRMPLVKNMETRHILVTGSTGSGKTNLMHNLLPQIEERGQPAIVIDQTGEMIAKYYNKERGDIIFNPFDKRAKAWDFWSDCGSREDLERFSKILIGFNRKQSGSHSDPFWENSAEAVFNACIEFLRPSKASIKDIVDMVCYTDMEHLKVALSGTEASRYLGDDSRHTASSIVSVLAANAKPLTYLRDIGDAGSFSMKQHFLDIQAGSKVWLFLSTKPSSRSLTLPLIACLTELALARLVEIGIDQKRRVWTIIDELPALGKLPALSPLMTEGRKYGACVLAGMQSLNQLYSQYGQYEGSTIFGQFGTSFFFRNTEPTIAKMVSSMCGTETIIRQQKNTSFGANTLRDGVSYSEQEQKKALVEIDDLSSLAVGECYTLLPEPAVRLSKMQTQRINLSDKYPAFVQVEECQNVDIPEEPEYTEELSGTGSDRSIKNIIPPNTEDNKNKETKKKFELKTSASLNKEVKSTSKKKIDIMEF